MDAKIKTLGVLTDCSRDAVYTVAALKKYMDLLSAMGYNMLQLYTEDTYEIPDAGDILLAEEERTYELIRNMFRSCSRCFTPRRINVGMDEAHMVGLGKYLDRHGFRPRSEVLAKHLSRVCAIAAEFGFKPMMWSDMFCGILKAALGRRMQAVRVREARRPAGRANSAAVALPGNAPVLRLAERRFCQAEIVSSLQTYSSVLRESVCLFFGLSP